jgi:hypothetical protein
MKLGKYLILVSKAKRFDWYRVKFPTRILCRYGWIQVDIFIEEEK